MDTLPDRPSGRAPDAMRAIQFDRGYTCHAEGSVLVSFGQTKVICTASVSAGVPGFLRGKGEGWLTAEYGMLPRSTGSRMEFDVDSSGARTSKAPVRGGRHDFFFFVNADGMSKFRAIQRSRFGMR